jgi:hypothetical protein
MACNRGDGDRPRARIDSERQRNIDMVPKELVADDDDARQSNPGRAAFGRLRRHWSNPGGFKKMKLLRGDLL